MGFFDRLSNGWKLGMTSLETIVKHPKLLSFPLLSGTALIMVSLTFFGGFALLFGLSFEAWIDDAFGDYLGYAILFGFYLVSYFVIVFFNVALVHCARAVFAGESVTLRDGLNFAGKRIDTILMWAVLAATVGMVLNILEERLGAIGKIISGIVGVVWSIATFFVVPILAYENVGPIDALKRSGMMMKEKWGEAIGANFGFGLFFLLGYVVVILTGIAIGFVIHPIAGIAVGILMALLLHTALSAAEVVFVAATYQHLHGEPHGNFEGDILDSVFMPKK